MEHLGATNHNNQRKRKVIMTESNIVQFPTTNFIAEDGKNSLNRLCYILHEKHITPKYLSYIVDIPVICIQKWMSGYPCPHDDLLRIAELLDVDPNWLISRQ